MAKRRSARVRGPSRASRPTRVRPLADTVSTRYIESSALLAALLEHDAGARASIRGRGRRVTSALTIAEAARAIVRASATGRLAPGQEPAALRALQRFARRCDIVAITDDILTRVGRRFPAEPIRTLDAVHLATAELLDDAPQLVTIVTRDLRVRENARALGFVVE